VSRFEFQQWGGKRKLLLSPSTEIDPVRTTRLIARKNTSTALSAEIAACHAHAFQTLTLLATISSEAFFDIRPSAIRDGKKRPATKRIPCLGTALCE
jgi:hypothetical protein